MALRFGKKKAAQKKSAVGRHAAPPKKKAPPRKQPAYDDLRERVARLEALVEELQRRIDVPALRATRVDVVDALRE